VTLIFCFVFKKKRKTLFVFGHEIQSIYTNLNHYFWEIAKKYAKRNLEGITLFAILYHGDFV
jgi:hypothetical protein